MSDLDFTGLSFMGPGVDPEAANDDHGHGHGHSTEEGHGEGPHGHGAGHSHEADDLLHPLDVASEDVFADVGHEEVSLFAEPASREGVPPFFQTDTLEAIPVGIRAAESHNVRAVSFIEPYKLVGHRRGRRAITLACPTTVTNAGGTGATPLGFQVSDDRSFLDVGAAFQVNPGDSLRIESEAEVWVSPLPGAASGYCQYVETFDAPSGPQP
ncbi:MAG: hypothetical protein ACYCU5_16405 [Actinomycetes bacterium]